MSAPARVAGPAVAGTRGTEPLLAVRDLRTEIDTEGGTVTAVDAVSFDLYHDEVLAVVGESGCGKTMLALSILGLLPRRTGRITSGQVLETLAEISHDLNGSILLITHDFGVVAGTADRVMVMYAGRLAEQGPVADVYRRPRHPIPSFRRRPESRCRQRTSPRGRGARQAVQHPPGHPESR